MGLLFSWNAWNSTAAWIGSQQKCITLKNMKSFACHGYAAKIWMNEPWCLFSSVPQPCSGNSTRERSAYLLRQHGEKKECPLTKETEPCKLNDNCFHYSYNITGDCMHLSVELAKKTYFEQDSMNLIFTSLIHEATSCFSWWHLSLQIGVPVSSVTEQCAEMASKPVCWTVCAVMVNLSI